MEGRSKSREKDLGWGWGVNSNGCFMIMICSINLTAVQATLNPCPPMIFWPLSKHVDSITRRPKSLHTHYYTHLRVSRIFFWQQRYVCSQVWIEAWLVCAHAMDRFLLVRDWEKKTNLNGQMFSTCCVGGHHHQSSPPLPKMARHINIWVWGKEKNYAYWPVVGQSSNISWMAIE